jgi:hypothetical protein
MRIHFAFLLAALAAACSSTATTTDSEGASPGKNDDAGTTPVADAATTNDDAAPVEKDASKQDGQQEKDAAPDVGPAARTFTDVYAIFTAKCTGCHQPSEGPRGALDLSTKAAAHAALVGIDAGGARCGASGTKRVVAGDAQKSLLFLKVSPAPPCGGRMPAGQGAQPLSQGEIDTIASWINAGAKND